MGTVCKGNDARFVGARHFYCDDCLIFLDSSDGFLISPIGPLTVASEQLSSISSHTEIYFFNFGSSGCIVMPIVGTIFLTFSCLLNKFVLFACSLTIVKLLRPLAELALGLCIFDSGKVLTGDKTVETNAVGDLIDSDIDLSV